MKNLTLNITKRIATRTTCNLPMKLMWTTISLTNWTWNRKLIKRSCTSSIPLKRPNSRHNLLINLNLKLRKKLKRSVPRETNFKNKQNRSLKLTLKPKSRLRRQLKLPLKPKRRVLKICKLDFKRSKRNGSPKRRNWSMKRKKPKRHRTWLRLLILLKRRKELKLPEKKQRLFRWKNKKLNKLGSSSTKAKNWPRKLKWRFKRKPSHIKRPSKNRLKSKNFKQT